MRLDEMGDRLGVGFRAKRVPVRRERRPQLDEVLDDSVEDDRHLALIAGRQGVGVLEGDPAVSRPARVADAPRGRGGPGDCLPAEDSKVPDGTGVPKAAVVGDAEPRGVVAAVLELLETG